MRHIGYLFLYRRALGNARADYLVDRQFGIGLVMSLFSLISGLVLIFERSNLLAADFTLRSGDYFSALDDRISGRGLVTIANQQYPVNFNGGAVDLIHEIDFDNLSGSNPVLFAACFNYSVNRRTSEN
jgi:hypothetical protein